MKKKEYTKIQEENMRMIYKLMDLRTEQFKQIYEHKWWENLIEDEMYKFLCGKLVEIRAINIYPTIKIAVTDEEIKLLSMKLISPEEFVKDTSQNHLDKYENK